MKKLDYLNARYMCIYVDIRIHLSAIMSTPPEAQSQNIIQLRGRMEARDRGESEAIILELFPVIRFNAQK